MCQRQIDLECVENVVVCGPVKCNHCDRPAIYFTEVGLLCEACACDYYDEKLATAVANAVADTGLANIS